MRLLLKNATIVDPSSDHHGRQADILIIGGVIEKIGRRIPAKDCEIIKSPDLHVSVGWLDMGTQVCDPGLEHREDLDSVSAAAAGGGYTAVACFPNTSPAIHNQSQVRYITRNASGRVVDFHPVGAITQNTAGKDITEMYDMYGAGAVAFSDGSHPIADNGMMMRALQYVKPFEGLIINRPHDKQSAYSGLMHEGVTSTMLGMKGIPSLSEELMLARDIQLAEYTESRLHVHNISTAKAVRMVKEAKRKKLKVTASVAALNLVYNDGALEEFDSNLKVLPPLREDKDRKALFKGLEDGTIDCITSNHTPWHIEAKDLEFPYAEFGVIGLETTFGLVNREWNTDVSDLIGKLSSAPREILGLKTKGIKKGMKANLTIFDPGISYVFEEKNIRSKSKNTPLVGEELKGEIIAVINNGKYFPNS